MGELFEIDYGAGYLRDSKDEQGRIKFKGYLVPVTGDLLSRAEREATIDRQSIRDTIIECDGMEYDTITDRIMELLDAAVKGDNDE